MSALYGYLLALQGEYVQVGRRGPGMLQGRVAAVHADYLTLVCPDQCAVHLPLRHLHAIHRLPPPAVPIPLGGAGSLPPTFAELAAANAGRPVRVNHAGPEVGIGTLRAGADDHLLVEVAPDEIVCYPLRHIHSLLVLADQAPGEG